MLTYFSFILSEIDAENVEAVFQEKGDEEGEESSELSLNLLHPLEESFCDRPIEKKSENAHRSSQLEEFGLLV